jgi:hypothetical protein
LFLTPYESGIATGVHATARTFSSTETSGSAVTNMEDPDGRTNFNALNLENATGFYWGVMGLTLNQNGYAWDFKSALEGPLVGAPTSPTYRDTGVGTCHGGR